MTLKYESEILFDLMKRDGDDAPSDVLPYESELKEKYLNQVVGAYPKLQDYRPEWLNYNLYHHLPSDFPTESVTNVTSASFHDVVPYAYKSAILTGNTLVNLAKTTSHNFAQGRTPVQNLSYSLKTGVTYTIIINVISVDASYGIYIRLVKNNANYTQLNMTLKSTGLHKITITPDIDFNQFAPYIQLSDYDSGLYASYNQLMIVEGDYTNIDIPYFEGMQSVKMPVLTTTGKNLFDGNLIGGYFNNNISSIVGDGGKYKSIIIKLNKGDYTLSFERPVYIIREIIDGVYNQNTRTATTYTFTLNTDGYYGVSFREAVSETIWSQTQVMIEQGTVATTYEPYKSNILSCLESVELRGIGEVQDTLDCLTGEVTERIGEGILNGSESWLQNSLKEQTNHWCFYNNKNLAGEKLLISDRFPQSDIDGDRESIRGGGDYIFVYISKEKVSGVVSFNQWLSQNPIKYQYKKSEESVKTVDLTVTDQDGNTESIIRPIEGTMHVSTSSQTLPPLLDMSVPVEATSQNLMSFANIVEEEK